MCKNRLCLVFLSILFLLLSTGCKNPNGSNDGSDNKDDEQILWTDSSNGYTEKVVLTETTEDGLKQTSLGYSVVEDSSGKGVAFGVIRLESNGNKVYKGVIAAKRRTMEFTNSFWDRYIISGGQNTVLMSDVVGGPTEEDGEFEYIIMGGLSELQLNYLKNASIINITITSSEDSSRNTSFICSGQFINNLIRYF